MNQKLDITTGLLEAHTLGFSNQDIATLLGVSLATVKRRKQDLGLGSTHQPNTTGQLGERLAAQHLADMGLDVTVMPPGAPYDLLVNGWRLDVKTSATPRKGHYRYVLPEQRPSLSGQYRYTKRYGDDADYLLLLVLQETRLSAAYVVPVAQRQASMTVHPESPFCPLACYRSAWHLLDAPQEKAV